MTVMEGVRAYLETCPGLEYLTLDDLGPEDGAACLRAIPAEPVQKTYLDGSMRRQARYALWLRRSGGDETARETQLRWSAALGETLEERTLRGELPELGAGRRAWSLRVLEASLPESRQEDGLLVDQLTLELIYLQEGTICCSKSI